MQTAAKQILGRYLARYAEPEVQNLSGWPAHCRYRQALVIPAYDESPDFVLRLQQSALLQHKPLLILVINRPDNVASCPANEQLLQALPSLLPRLWQHGSLSLLGNEHWGVLCVDRQQQPIPHKQGVGLARKLGVDLAVQLIDSGALTSSWIHSTDADARLPDDYFCTAALTGDVAAGVYDFVHRRDTDPVALATAHYERTLRHYVEGLRSAGSPYAFHTIGSTLVINARHYCQARGFPKRSGGEDFYLLNKLAKLGTIASLPARITLEPRLSHRVPFGTGPATRAILATQARGEPLCSYHPAVFEQLGDCIRTFEETFGQGQPPESALARLAPINRQALTSLGIERCLKHLQQRRDGHWQQQHFHWWLDAFRTLKLIHWLEREAFAPQPLAVD